MLPVGRRFESSLPHPSFTTELSCITMPWEVPEGTVVVEQFEGLWRVVSLGRAVSIFRRREDAMTYAIKIAALYDPPWTIVERTPPARDAIA